MRSILVLMAGLIVGPACAADPKDEHGKPAAGGGHGPVKYKVTGHDGKEKTVDVSDPKQFDELASELKDGHPHELKKDEPLDLFGIKRWDLGVWSLIIFLVLFGVLAKFAWGPMLKGLKKREDNIRGALDQAEQTRRQAMELQSQLDAKMRDAGGEIAKLMDDARRDATAVKEQMVAEARAQIQQDRDRQIREIAAAKSKAMQEMWEQSVALATMISEKVVRRKLSEEDHRRLLDESLADLKQYAGTVRHA